MVQLRCSVERLMVSLMQGSISVAGLQNMLVVCSLLILFEVVVVFVQMPTS